MLEAVTVAELKGTVTNENVVAVGADVMRPVPLHANTFVYTVTLSPTTKLWVAEVVMVIVFPAFATFVMIHCF